MAEAAQNYQRHEDFWKPAASLRAQTVDAAELARTRCGYCRAELLLESKFCHACGSPQPESRSQSHSFASQIELALVSSAQKQGLASFIAVALGCVCLIAAITVGFLFTVTKFSDWQALQIWRIEWLLGAIALFLAGILLKRLPSQKS